MRSVNTSALCVRNSNVGFALDDGRLRWTRSRYPGGLAGSTTICVHDANRHPAQTPGWSRRGTNAFSGCKLRFPSYVISM
jgi:hypothetical protein